MRHTLLTASALAALCACTTDKTCDSGQCESRTETGPDFYDGPIEIETVTYNCDVLGWWYTVHTVGWTGSADLYIYQTGSSPPWDELHPFPSLASDYDPYGAWEERYLELDHVEEYRDVVEGETTLYDCDDTRKATLTWVVVVTDTEGAEADCGAWGDDPSYGEGAGCDVL